MKKIIPIVVLIAVMLGWYCYQVKIHAAEGGAFQTYEYVTIRLDGRDNTHVIRSNGKVERLGTILKAVTRPNQADERAFYMNIAMNAVAREGYEFAGMSSNEIVMKRALAR